MSFILFLLPGILLTSLAPIYAANDLPTTIILPEQEYQEAARQFIHLLHSQKTPLSNIEQYLNTRLTRAKSILLGNASSAMLNALLDEPYYRNSEKITFEGTLQVSWEVNWQDHTEQAIFAYVIMTNQLFFKLIELLRNQEEQVDPETRGFTNEELQIWTQEVLRNNISDSFLFTASQHFSYEILQQLKSILSEPIHNKEPQKNIIDEEQERKKMKLSN